MLKVDAFPIQPIGGNTGPSATKYHINLKEAFNHPSLMPVGFLDIGLDQRPTSQTNGLTDWWSREPEATNPQAEQNDSSCPTLLGGYPSSNEEEHDSSCDEDVDDSSCPPSPLSRSVGWSSEVYVYAMYIVAACRGLSRHDPESTNASVPPPTTRASTPEEILALLNYGFVPEDVTPSVFAIVPKDSSMQALAAAFCGLPISSGPDAVP
jgi:hypothetical protein